MMGVRGKRKRDRFVGRVDPSAMSIRAGLQALIGFVPFCWIVCYIIFSNF